jgi:hypothetical protein
LGNKPLPKQWSYLRQVALRFIIVLALLQISLGSYGIWFDLTLRASVVTAGGILALSVVPLRYRMPSVSRFATVVGGVMGLAVGFPLYALFPFLLALLGFITYSRPRAERELATDS